jgi:hypothetical protein
LGRRTEAHTGRQGVWDDAQEAAALDLVGGWCGGGELRSVRVVEGGIVDGRKRTSTRAPYPLSFSKAPKGGPR